ncbi:MAG: hypothetical protein ACK448_10705 [Bacteroidota bacterium]
MKLLTNWIRTVSILLTIIFLAAQSQHFHHHGDSHNHSESTSCENGHNHPIHKHDGNCNNTQHITEDCSYCDWQQPLVNQSNLSVSTNSLSFSLAIIAIFHQNPFLKPAIRKNSNKAPPTV